MKMFLAASVLLLASYAQAEVKPFGMFVPKACSMPQDNTGFETDMIAVKKVCLGVLASVDQQAVQLYLNDGSVQLYEIDVKKTTIRMGANTQPFIGESVSTWDSSIRGEIITVMGIRKSMIIKLETTENLKFQGNIEAVYTTL